MTYIKLDDVNEAHLLGTWQVKNRTFNTQSASHLFITFQSLRFQKNKAFSAQNGKKSEGRWEIIKEHEVIYNPQVKFRMGKEVVANCIITNLMTTDDTHTKLILYFDSGFELVLEKIAEIKNRRQLKKS